MTTRIYQNVPLKENDKLILNESASHHLSRVLRAKIKDEIILFNGHGGEYQACITDITKKHVEVNIGKYIEKNTESALNLYLAQAISRGERMDFTIQKAVELGVKKIIPLLTERCNVKLDEDRKEKRLLHWQSIIISACEQSGRTHLPELSEPQNFSKWIESSTEKLRFVLFPTSKQKLKNITLNSSDGVLLLIGPEGGLSENEISRAEQKGFIPLSLGPRILRTETAGITAISILQYEFGDLG